MKDVIIGFLKSNKKLIIGIFVVIVLIIFLASSSYIIKVGDTANSNHSSSWGGVSVGSNSTNMNARVENEISSQVSVGNIVLKDNGADNEDDYKFNIDLDEKVKELYDEFSKTEEGRRKLNYIAGSESDQKELLKKMIKAELITQYPDLRAVSNMNKEVDANEIQGVIKFKRVLSDNIKKGTWIIKSEDTSIELNGGIVSWGDELTLGDVNNSSNNYPALLAEELQKNVYNLGVEGATSQEIALLAGVEKYTLVTTNEEDVTIGKELGSEITISVSLKKDGSEITKTPFKKFDGSDDNKKLECTINDVDGELTYKKDSETYVFKRKTEGEEIKISKNTTISFKTQSGYKSAFPIIWIGNGNSKCDKNASSIKAITEDCWSLINMSVDPDNYIVIIPMYYRDTEDGELKKYTTDEYNNIRDTFKKESGFNTNQVLDLYDNDSDYSGIVDAIVQCMENNNFKTKIGGEYYQNVSDDKIIELSDDECLKSGSTITLEYIPLGNALEPAPGTLMWLINNSDVNKQKAALQYFSLDASGNLIVANWSKVTTTIEKFTDPDGNRDGYVCDARSTEVQYTIVPSKVNYKDSISQYTMPFDYLWAWLVMGDDTEFVEKLTDLALNSSIEATLYDELTVVENDVVDELTNGYKTKYYYQTIRVTQSGSTRTESESESERYEDKKEHTKIVTETNKIKYRLTFADVWYLTYKVDGIERLEYNGEEGMSSVSFNDTTSTGSSNTIEINDLYQKTVNNVTDVDWTESGPRRGPYADQTSTDATGAYTVTSHEEQDYTSVKDHVITTTITKRGWKYSSGITSIKEKTDKNYTQEEMESGNFSEPNFVKYYIYCSAARNSIQSITSWLFTALENNSRTEGLLDITKYMLYKATDNDYGVTSMDFSAYSEQDFIDVEDVIVNDGGSSFNGGDGTGTATGGTATGGTVTGTGGDGSISSDSGDHYWGVYKRGDKEYKCYYQNSYSGKFYNQGCVATAVAICHSGYGSSNTPIDYWNGKAAWGVKQIARTADAITEALNDNVPVIIDILTDDWEFYCTPSSQTDCGHAIVLVDINSNGEVYVINPWYKSGKWCGWYSLVDDILKWPTGTGAPNTLGTSGVGIVTY